MPDNPRNDDTPSDFDDWLSEESAPATDPYAALAEEPVEEEIDQWQSFASSDADSVSVESEALEASEPAGVSSVADDVEDTTGEVEAVEPPAANDALFEPIDEPDPSDQVIIQDAIVPDEVPADYTVDDSVNTPDLIVDVAQDEDDTTGEVEAVTFDGSSGLEEESLEELSLEELSLEDTEPVVELAGFGDSFDGADQPEAPVVEFEAFDGGTEPDTAEVEIIAPEPFESTAEAALTPDDEAGDSVEDDAWFAGDPIDTSVVADIDDTGGIVPFEFPEAPSDANFDPFEDTGEAVFVAGAGVVGAGVSSGAASFADLWGDAPVAGDPVGDQGVAGAVSGESDDFDLDEGTLLHGTTREHTDLAAAIAAAETEDTAQVALVAEIPGLESSVVGFEDVVEAEGHRKVRARASGDLIARVVTGAVLVLALAASLVWRPALLALAVTVFVLGAGEFYTALARSGRKPIALFGFVGILGASLGAYFWSAAAIPIAFLLATVMLLLFYAVVPGKDDPLGNLALTTTVMVWAGLGSFALLIARSDDYQVLVLGVVVAVAAADIGAFFVGRSLGRTHFAPWVSPKKTVEGLVAGTIVAIAVGAGLEFFEPFELTSGLAIGAAAAVFTPLGDLAMSAAKRSLGLKDMGSVLPGHGGFLDRIDGLLFTIPVAWAILTWAGLL